MTDQKETTANVTTWCLYAKQPYSYTWRQMTGWTDCVAEEGEDLLDVVRDAAYEYNITDDNNTDEISARQVTGPEPGKRIVFDVQTKRTVSVSQKDQ